MSEHKWGESEPEGGSVWPDTLNIRDTGIIPDDGGGRIYTTVGFGYKKIKYVRGDKIADLERQLAEKQAEIEAMRPVVEAANGVAYPTHSLARALREYESRKQP